MSDPERPSGEATDAQTGKAPAVSSCAKRQLLAALTTTDVTIRRLDLLLSEANGQERVLATINYVASMLHHLTASAPWIALQTRLGILARLKGRVPKNVTPASSKSKFAALCSLASETRYNLRLFGLLPLWIWGAETLKSPPTDPILHALTVLQVISNVIYQLLENVGYLASKGVVSKRFVDKYGGVAKWEIWSTRGWFGHIFFQFFVLWRQSVLRRQRLAAQRAAAGTVETKETKAEDSEALRLEIRAWRKSLVNNVFWAPLCLHWCFEKGIGIPDSMVGIISFCAGAWSLHDCWAGTATVKA
ncbi:hypothetical protein E8E15_007703 [Penicillium rubens]|uniref:Peroxin-11C Pex11C-Penicillium chrysogenum n=2 Tax=Penicillium chrysogenum species complex TaxID=254878 RepID=B6HJ40_PENRW|nr:peroxin 11C [Penicillium chrysogenum]KAF3019183.1 hypothetical protein E8E15_007703 [Penicillium rubens]KAJ5049943.1 hypothetical protein NUH16_008466 [Penicillium rubens]KZN89480.1 hypothetical protein EN45_080870 [Penicillium chrysogenum]CAP96825.1 peroxin-11C Pex11C-Penicillium chrysogenum [Penicillium rubens Wisconsin 54-1255]